MTSKDERLKELEEEIKLSSKIEETAKTEGGQELIKALGEDIVSGIDELRGKYRTATHIELIGIIARLSERLLIFRSLKRAEKNKRAAKKEYENTLKDLLE